MRHTIDEMHEYIHQWYHNEQWTDFNMAWDSGYTDLAMKLLIDAGAINSDLCYEDSKSIERAIEQRMKKYTKKKWGQDSKACFGNAEVYVDPKTNEHAFVKNEYVDYLIDLDEMFALGYVTSEEFYEGVIK